VKRNPATFPGSEKLSFSMGFYEGDNTPIAVHPGSIPPGRWIFIEIPLRRERLYPFLLNYFSIVSINPAADETGHIYLCDLHALYTPHPL
jgi:hypothetical protein